MSKLHAVLFTLALASAAPFAMAEDPVVNINTADATELSRTLVGVGPAKAQAIIEHREKFGPFTSIDELRYVKGIGASTVEQNRSRMTVGESGAETARSRR